MNGDFRRERILEMIRAQQLPLSATNLAQTLNVSRQVIVGDVALLRSQGCEIIATARGYVIPRFKETGQYLGKIACQHTPKKMTDELYTIVDSGAVVVNVIVEHELYGEITGCLNLMSRDDIDLFSEKVKSSKDRLLSELTMGIHLHTVACRDNDHFQQVCQELELKGFLLQGVDKNIM